jgi:hypothetical protein
VRQSHRFKLQADAQPEEFTMKTAPCLLLITLIVTAIAPLQSGAQAPGEWRDDLVDHMVGTWKLQGTVMARDAHHEVDAEWVLNHQFHRIREKTAAGAPGSENG